jgi:hypothetical protein
MLGYQMRVRGIDELRLTPIPAGGGFGSADTRAMCRGAANLTGERLCEYVK